MRTLIPFFLLVVAFTALYIVMPAEVRKSLFTRKHIGIVIFIVFAWIAVLALAAVQSNFVVPLF